MDYTDENISKIRNSLLTETNFHSRYQADRLISYLLAEVGGWKAGALINRAANDNLKALLEEQRARCAASDAYKAKSEALQDLANDQAALIVEILSGVSPS